MPTTTFPPILIWQPGGGTPVGPVSNPPVYSQSDITQLVINQAYVDVVFGSVQTDNNWVLVTCEVENSTDLDPLNIWPGIITSRTPAGFRLQLNGMPDSGNYYLHWAVSGVNITPVPATLYLFTGPTSAPFGINEPFTVKLPPSTTLGAPITITPNDGGAGGTFSPSTVTLSSGSATATFVYNAVAYGAATISVTNSGTLTDPASIVFTSIAPTYTFTGPSSGNVGVPSTNFTVNIGGQTLAAPTTITPNDGGGGGTFTPTTVVLDTGSAPQHFTYTPASSGAKTISVTNNRGLTDPGSLTYTAAASPHLLNTLISYWKLDEASTASGFVQRNDSVGTNHMTEEVAFTPSIAGVIGNGLDFTSGAKDIYVNDNATLRVSGDFTISIWVKPTVVLDSVIFIKYNGTDPVYEYAVSYFGSGAGFKMQATGVPAVSVGSLATLGTWYHVVGWYDSSDGKARLRINDATTYTGTAGTLAAASTGKLSIGAISGGFSAFDGAVDEIGFWKRVLTSVEITALYNGGAGLPFSSFTS